MSKSTTSKTTFSRPIIIPSLLFIVSVSLLISIFPTESQKIMGIVQEFIFTKLNWVYVLAVSIFIFFLLFLVLSKYGSIKLGSETSKPDYSFTTWVAMLFAAGMGIGLMYFGVAEPIAHFAEPALQLENTMQTAKQAQVYTFFHWGIHAWAIYAVVGLSLAYFTYRYKLPLSLRSCFYPILKDKIQGRTGNMIDIFALCSTFFGLTTTLGFGVVQMGAGLKQLGLFGDAQFGMYVIIVVVIMIISVFSASSGVNKGIKILSYVNILIAILLMLFILLTGPTSFLLGSFSEGLGNYMTNFLEMTFNTSAYATERQAWHFDWTILYWAWWISWAPYVGLFIAKISKGRTIREFIIAVLLLPSLFNFMWMTIFGNSAIWIDINVADGALSAVAGDSDTLLFRFLDYLPLSIVTSIASIVIICIFFVTSADSGIFVMNNVASKNSHMAKYILGFYAWRSSFGAVKFRWITSLANYDSDYCPSLCCYYVVVLL